MYAHISKGSSQSLQLWIQGTVFPLYTKQPSTRLQPIIEMSKLVQFDYLFAIGTIFAFLDAWNIGANDVANSFATSVSSRPLTYIRWGGSISSGVVQVFLA